MKLYHGSVMKISNPGIIKNEIGRDFGFAFYTTDIEEQAKRWAIRKAKIANRKAETPCKAVINLYEWNEMNAN